MFNGQQQHQQQHHHHQPQDVPSDSQWYQDNYERAHCTNYLCPGTLSCVAVPHHCPCAHPVYEEKFELADGNAICISKGDLKPGGSEEGGVGSERVDLGFLGGNF
ncbi:hypothetical protein DID88_009587 [Monilinia fructigena]|uniref:Long chronological lifespan protein 2 n=1 Tax=Monilinia fructigena TaxID=38457 RepID=A0A395IPP8_9HELO|nr:hypothetical protein DID88_009587 [Monilinia fructigena]